MADVSSTPNLDDLLQHVDWVRRLALQLCTDVHAAEDAMQETWAAALRRPPQRGDNLPGFFARLLRNALGQRVRGDVRRRARERAVGVHSPFVEAAADAVQRAELHRTLVDLVLRLPEPQQALVLMHYFDGVEIDALARRMPFSADAVRSHLRRARERLRGQLERSDRSVQRGLALLCGARHAAHPVSATTMAAATAATICMSSLKTKLLLAGLAATAAIAVWVELPAPSAATSPAGSSANVVAPAVATLDDAPRDVPSHPSADQRTAVPAAVEEQVVHCRLVGLRTDAPWTAAVKVVLEGTGPGPRTQRHTVQLEPDADGRFELRLPGWTATCALLDAHFTAEDPLYVACDVHERAPSLAECQLVVRDVYELRVQAAALMSGRVVDSGGVPVPAANVVAFAMRDGLPRDPSLASAGTNEVGDYVLRIPAAADVLLVAVAMQGVLSGTPDEQAHVASLALRSRVVERNGVVAMTDRLRPELLPACVQRRGRFGARDEVPTLVLAASAVVDGTVLLPDGSPADGIRVHLSCTGDATLTAPSLSVAWWRDDSCAPQPWAVTDKLGQFELRGDPRHSGVVTIGPSPERPTQKPIERLVTPPAHVEIRLEGRTLRIRSRLDGLPASVSFMAGDERTMGLMGTDQRGELTMLVPAGQSFYLLTREPGYTVFETRVKAGEVLPEVIEIDLQRLSTVPVTVECEDPIAVGLAQFAWHLADATRLGQEIRIATRQADGLFHFDVPPGRHRLRITACNGAPGLEGFLIASEREVDVPPAGAALRLPTAHGGRLRIEVLDARGLLVPGTVRIVDPSGRESTPLFRGRDDGSERAGVLLATKASETRDNLPTGRYELAIDLGARGVHRRGIDVRVGVVTEVRVEVP